MRQGRAVYLASSAKCPSLLQVILPSWPRETREITDQWRLHCVPSSAGFCLERYSRQGLAGAQGAPSPVPTTTEMGNSCHRPGRGSRGKAIASLGLVLGQAAACGRGQLGRRAQGKTSPGGTKRAEGRRPWGFFKITPHLAELLTSTSVLSVPRML